MSRNRRTTGMCVGELSAGRGRCAVVSQIRATGAVLLVVATAALGLDVLVTDAPYNAAGNGSTNDRAAIQAAINAVSAAGGGRVTLPGGLTFLTGDLTLKSNVTLFISPTAVLKQSTDAGDYAHTTNYGKALEGTGIIWDTWMDRNYPIVYSGNGTKNVKVTGGGKILTSFTGDINTSICAMSIGMWRTDSFEISDLVLDGQFSYNINIHQCRNGVIRNVKTINPVMSEWNSDGISMEGCQHIEVYACTLYTNDDGIYCWSSYRDPRGLTWWNSDNPMPTLDIEVYHCFAQPQGAYKAWTFFPWGDESPDQSMVEIRDVYVHDNYLAPVNSGGWSVCSQSLDPTHDRGHVAMCDIVFENNNYNGMRREFQDNPQFTNSLFDFTDVRSESQFLNAGFEMDGIPYWSYARNSDQTSAGAASNGVGQTGSWYGFIDKLNSGDARIFQGLHLSSGTYGFRADVQSSGATVRMSVRDRNDNLVAAQDFSNTGWVTRTLNFTASSTGLYRLGIERGSATSGWARIDQASVGVPSATGLTASMSAAPQSGEAPLEVSFDGSGSSDDGTIVSYEWDFGDGQSGSGVTATHTYPSTGTYTARLTVTDNDQNTASATRTIAVAACEAGWIFTNQTPSGSSSDARYELGTRFESMCAGTITAVRIYAGAQEGGDRTVRIWRASNQSVVSGPHTMSFTSGQAGWKSFPLPAPLAIEASTEYVVSVSNSSDNYYSSSSGGFSSAISNGSLITYTSSGVYSTTLGSMPTQAYENTNYFRDVQFQPSSTNGISRLQRQVNRCTVRLTEHSILIQGQSSFRLRVVNARGETVRREKGHGPASVSTGSLARGVYRVVIDTPEGAMESISLVKL